jgi:hypothetical protein
MMKTLARNHVISHVLCVWYVTRNGLQLLRGVVKKNIDH